MIYNMRAIIILFADCSNAQKQQGDPANEDLPFGALLVDDVLNRRNCYVSKSIAFLLLNCR